MRNLTLPIPADDDARQKRARQRARRAARRIDDLDSATVAERSCSTCQSWTQTGETWGECRHTLVTRERVSRELYPPDGIEPGTIVAAWPNPHRTGITCVEPAWPVAKALGRATALRTHRGFSACDRYVQGEAADRPPRRHGLSLRDRVQGRAA